MNKWIKRSIEIANAPGYLDRLSAIYVMQVNPIRSLNNDLKKKVEIAYKSKKNVELISLLLKAPIFPVKDSYLGFLRAKPEAIHENPHTINRICERLYSLGLKRFFQETTRPIETNRQQGNAFPRWLHTLGYPVLKPIDFDRASGIAILEGSDKSLKEYAFSKLGCRLDKGIDILLKKGDIYVIGEAKFLTTPGGEQDRGFDDASSFIRGKSGNAKRIAFLDGYIWLKSKKGIHNKIVRSNLDIFSALLLNDYIEEL